MAVNIAKTTIPQITPAIIGPFGVGLGVSTTTVVVSLGAAEVVDAVTAFWDVGEGADVDEDVRMLEVAEGLEITEELDDIVSGQVGRSQASTEQQPVKLLATQTYHWVPEGQLRSWRSLRLRYILNCEGIQEYDNKERREGRRTGSHVNC